MNKDMKPNVEGGDAQHKPLEVFAEDVVEAKSRLTIQFRDPSRKRKHRMRSEQIVSDDYTHDTQKWNKKHRLIDVDNDWYSEKLTDGDTGEILHLCEEPLSKHRGHGSAKKEKPPNSF